MDMVAELDAGHSGLEQLQALLEAGGLPPIGRTLDIALVEVGEGRAVFEGRPSLKVYNPIGMVHGGYAANRLCAGRRDLRPAARRLRR
jgi:acyl-coenzyme A thioesterase PaaI-like protein